MAVRLVSGWSLPGGSTTHHIELVNLLNANGYEAIFYGPQEWHLDKCNGKLLADFEFEDGDVFINHFTKAVPPPNASVSVLSCHETNLYPLKQNKFLYEGFDCIQFVSNFQKKWHSVNHPSVIIPPVVNYIKYTQPNTNVAGVIGSIDEHKQPHKAIEKALKDGFKKVLLFGTITDQEYFNIKIFPYVVNRQAVLRNYEEDREKMYNQVDKVYHASRRETYGLVHAECAVSNIPFEDIKKRSIELINKEDILKRWIKTLKLESICQPYRS